MSRVVKRKIYEKFSKNFQPLSKELEAAYTDMLDSFDQSQQYLNRREFCAFYDGDADEVQEAVPDAPQENLHKISYFTDFILM